jgi:hypothetical protein
MTPASGFEQLFETAPRRPIPHNWRSRHGQGRNFTGPSPLDAPSNPARRRSMRSILYVIGVVVVILVLLSLLS